MHRKIIGLLTTFVLCTSSLMATPLPELMSDGAMLIEPTTNTIIYSKNGHQTFYPASTTKVLTSLLLVEDLQLNTMITKTKDAIQNVPSDSSHIGLLAGDTYTAFDGLHAIMMASDNFVSYDMCVLVCVLVCVYWCVCTGVCIGACTGACIGVCIRSEERRVGKECVSKCGCRWGRCH